MRILPFLYTTETFLCLTINNSITDIFTLGKISSNRVTFGGINIKSHIAFENSLASITQFQFFAGIMLANSLLRDYQKIIFEYALIHINHHMHLHSPSDKRQTHNRLERATFSILWSEHPFNIWKTFQIWIDLDQGDGQFRERMTFFSTSENYPKLPEMFRNSQKHPRSAENNSRQSKKNKYNKNNILLNYLGCFRVFWPVFLMLWTISVDFWLFCHYL